MKVAVVGATGLVGRKMLQVLEERNFPVTELIPVASESSVGREITFKNRTYKVVGTREAIQMKPQVAIFSAGGETSLTWAPQFAAAGTTVIDNSSAWRMDPAKKLIIPEINADTLTRDDKIIANPNCSTIQMLMAIAPLHKKYKIKRMVVSTYQSVTGSGLKGITQLEGEREGKEVKKAYAHPIDRNCLPHCDSFTENGYTKEEMKLVNETCKILNDDSIKVTATAVRVPVTGGHSESINIEFERDYNLDDIRNLLSQTPGVVVQDDPSQNIYPMALTANEKDEVFVGRIRRDFSRENSLNLWVVSDNLRKGAATNAVQIAEYLNKQQLL
ncbi:MULTISPECIES: aspartate-semialdehyde dehydrogenase [Sanguibacteroides]|uniref:Aspartate-semialdehyde dehydrogenase n=1 Tax=Sanguibacteroides justesenii TaxID=1547597 RepID=A0A0C3R4E3_9PORP|nr:MULTISPECIES: aspartate-semialdehyde dehydrogenase [Sanguibacteroides]KIO44285.1 aspartate-semialdehyde dehydrogenase [Sanguibacteroides justesenii]KIO45498.1 aspartate-semialdehyde dehydrogenase [Sanguibacteroides justesenii]PXZ44784.1 aspartate-semialdehyde dehydrogenase [Sanguibacteroides justesenii]